jgi:hypothetical protein
MLDNIARKCALIETIMRLESDSDLGAMESFAATFSSVAQAPVPKPKTRKPKKEVNRLRSVEEILASREKDDYKLCITKGDKSIDPKPLFGIWKDNPRNLEEIRKKDWTRNWHL